MQFSVWLLLAIVALTKTSHANVNVSSLCSSVATCYEGGDSSTPCTVLEEDCPPCVTFADDGCYIGVDGACPFGVDCSSFFYPSTRSSVSSTSGDATTGVGPSSSSTPTAAASSGSTPRTGSSSKDSVGGDSVDANSGSDSSNTVLVVAILAVALGVAIVAVVVRRLFLRARASSHENREVEGVPTPPPTEMTASFSSDGSSRHARGTTMVTRSAVGTDLSASKTSTA